MKKYILKISLIFLLIFALSAKIFSQKDTVFWFSAPEVNRYHAGGTDLNPDNEGIPVYLHLTTFEYPANVTISMPANIFFTPIDTFIAANTTLRLDLSDYVDLDIVNEFNSIENQLRWTTSNLGIAQPFINKGTKGIKISSDSDITAYYEISVLYNMDLISLKGNNGLGKQFYVPFQTTNVTRSYNYLNRPYSSIDIVATEDNTKIKVTTNKAIWAKGGVPEAKPAGTHIIWLDKGETSIITPYEAQAYTYLGQTTYQTSFTLRLDGSYVEVDTTEGSGGRIAVITHDDIVKSNYSSNPDYVTDQLVPIEHIGTDYAVIQGVGYDVTLPGIEIEDYVYVLGTVDGTTFTATRGPSGVVTNHSVDAGGTVDISMNDINSRVVTINSSHPVYVYHMSGAGRQKAGAIIPTISKCTGSYKVAFNRTKAGSYKFYLTILARTTAVGNFRLLRNSIDVTDPNDIAVLATINNPANYSALPEAGDPYDNWVYARIDADDLTANVAYLLANDVNFFHLGVINGYTANDAFYGYFSNFNEITASAFEASGKALIGQVCEGDTVQLQAEGGTFYEWLPHDYIIDDPFSANPKVVLPPGIYNYDVHIVGECDLDKVITIQLECLPNPEAFFTLSSYTGCAPFEITIQNQSSGADKFRWDFTNNASFDLETNDPSGVITYTYNNTTSTDSVYSIRMVARETGVICTDEFTSTLQVFPEMTAGFVPDIVTGCNPLTVSFTDNSSGDLDKYQWVFDDGVVLNTTGDVTHEFSHVNTVDTAEYDVELRLTSPYFCRDTARTTIRVFPYIEGEFTIDTAVGCSPLTVTFTNVSAGEDQIDLDYGDGSAHLVGATFGTVTHTYRNTGTTVAYYPVELQALNDEGCLKIWRDTIIVYPEVRASYTVDAPSPYTGCNSRTFNFTNTSNNGAHTASSYLWTFGDGSNTTSASYAKTYNNTTTSDQTYTFNLHAESQYGCYDDTTNQIRINRAYADFTVNTDEGCSPLPVTITNISIGNQITTWAWNFGDATYSAVKNPPVKTYTNTTGATQTRNMQLTVTGTSGCSTSKTIPIDVFSSVDISFTPVNQTGCDSLVIPFNSTINPNIASSTYIWTFDDGTSSSLADPTHIYRNLTSNANIIYNPKVVVTTPRGCKDSSTTSITVRPYVNAKFTVDKVAGCSPLTVDPIATSYIGVATYRWNFGDGSPIVTGVNPAAHTYPVNTTGSDVTYTLQLEVLDPSGNCTDIATKTITVYSEANADFNPKASSSCNPYTITFDNLSFNAASYKWNFGDGGTSSTLFEPTYVFNNTTNALKTFNVSLEVTSNRGCVDTISSTVNVYRYVNADFDVNISEDCSPLTVSITNNSRGGTYRWYWNNAAATGVADYTSTSGTETFTHEYTNTTGSDIKFYLTLVAQNTNGCTDTLTKEILLHSSITAGFSNVQNDACNPSDVVFTNTSTGGGSYTMNWDFGDGGTLTTTANTVNKQFINNTTNDKVFTVVMTAESENGCTDTYTDSVTVYSKLIADFSIDDNEGCPPFTTTIVNTSIGNAGNTYQWLIDNAAVGGSPTNKDDFTHTYDNLLTSIRNYNIRLIATNAHGCTSEYSDVITVYEYVEASYAMDLDEGCNPLEIQFTDLSSVPASTKYTWVFGDGATSGAASPAHTFYNSSRETDKPYNIKLTVQSPNYCTDDTTQSIMVYHQPLAKFFIDKTSSCPPLESYLDKTESLGEDMFEWRFGDGTANNTTNETLTHQFNSTGAGIVDPYKLELWVGTNESCMDSTSLTVNVFPSVTADFSFAYLDDYCSPSEIEFTDNSSAWVENYYWRFDDGNTSNLEDPTNRYEITVDNDMVYHVFLRVASQYNCWDTITKPVPVYVQPYSSFDISPIVQKFPESSVSITNKSNYGPFNYLWEYGDMDLTTSTQRNASPNPFVYEHWGLKDIRLTITSQTSTCADTSMKTATILPPDVNAAFSTNIDGGCLDEGLEVQFTAAQSNYNEEYDYTWDFGDGSDIATGQYVTHTYTQPGTFYVKMIARSQQEGGGEDFDYKTIRVYTNPIANFEVLPSVSMIDNKTLEARVEFYNLSQCNDTSGCSYLWEFGDGSTAISRDVTHGYTELGKYDVRLTVTNSAGCIDTLTKPQEVEIIGVGEIEFPNAFTPNGDGLNDVFRPVSQGVIKYELFIYNRWGELIFTTKDLAAGWNGTVKGEPAKPDVYVWKAIGNFTNGRGFEIAGDVTLIR